MYFKQVPLKRGGNIFIINTIDKSNSDTFNKCDVFDFGVEFKILGMCSREKKYVFGVENEEIL